MNKIVKSYVLLLFFCIIACLLFFFMVTEKPTSIEIENCENIYFCFTDNYCLQKEYKFKPGVTSKNYLLYTSKILKIISFIFIFYGILLWMYKLDNDQSDREKQKKFGITVSLFTLFSFLVLYGQVTVFYNCPSCIKEINSSFPYKGDYFVSIVPLLAIAISNGILMNGGTTMIHNGFRRYLYIVYIPVIVAAISIFILAIILENFVDIIDVQDLSIMVSGSMAFLVFVTYCTEQTLEEHENLSLFNQNPPVIPPETKVKESSH